MPLRLKNGTVIEPRQLVVLAVDGELVDVRGTDLQVGDWVGMPYGEGFLDHTVRIPQFQLPPSHGSQKRVQLPRVLDQDLALLLGMYASEGHTTAGNYTISITNSEDPVLERCVELWDTCFGLKARLVRPSDRCPSVTVASKTVTELFAALECGSRARDKRIPYLVMGSSLPTVQSFLQGLALDAYTATTGHDAKWAICLDSPILLDDLQLLLRWWGLRSGRISKYNPRYGKTYDEVYLSGPEAQTFLAAVPFLEPSKQASARRLASMTFDPRRNGADVIPVVHGSVLHALIPKGQSGRNGKGTRTSQWRSLADPRTTWPSRAMVERLAVAGIALPEHIERVLAERLHFSPVVQLG